MTDDIAPRILAAIVRASSKRPARASEVLARLDAPAPESQAALDRLIASRQVATARIQRRNDPEPWLAIWPTGVTLRHGAWSNDTHSALFERDTSINRKLRDASAPRVRPGIDQDAPPPPPTGQEEPAMTTIYAPRERLAKGQLQTLIASALHEAGGPMTCKQLAERTDRSIECIRMICKTMVDKGLLEPDDSLPLQAFRLAPQPAATAAAPTTAGITVTEIEPEQIEAAPAPAVEAPEQPEPLTELRGRDATSPSPEVHFALWDDGQLTIDDGEQIIVLPPSRTARLAALLGVPLELAH